MSGPMNKHQNLARHNDPYEDQPVGKGTGGLRNNDAEHDSWKGGEDHIHETEPSKDGSPHHGSHGHSDMSENSGHGKHGHKDVHEHYPEHHRGGHKKY